MKGEPQDRTTGDSDLTALLLRWSAGDKNVLEALSAGLYAELKRLARIQFSGERAGHTLQPTALVSEAWMKLIQADQVEWRDRAHFMAVAARVMRQILVDSGRRKRAVKRRTPTTVQLGQAVDSPVVDLLALDQALARLEDMDADQARVVELRYFGGLTIPETAEVLDVSVATVNRSWRAARAWLFLQLEPAGA